MRFETVRACLLLLGIGSIALFATLGALRGSGDCGLAALPNATVLGVTFTLRNGATVTPAVVRQVEALRNCTSNTTQPLIILDDLEPLGAHYNDGYDGCGKRIIYGPSKESHLTLLVHEMVHFFDDTRYAFQMPCATDLFSEMIEGASTWGDNGGYPYCYNRAVPNKHEYLAILSEGYCASECGPTLQYLTNASNQIASRQLACAQSLMGQRPL